MDKRWTAEWIQDEAFAGLQAFDPYHKEMKPKEMPAHQEDLMNVHMLARKSFRLDGPIREAELTVTADDYYKLYINGQFVGQGPAQSRADRYYYNRFDAAPFLRAGDNVIAVHVYYHGLISRSYNSGDYRQGVIAELTVNGRLAVKTDGTWKAARAREYASGGVIGYNTQHLENIDSRLQLRHWRDAGYDDAGWRQASTRAADDHRLYLQPTPPLDVYEVYPASIAPLAGNGYLLDFGGELTGQLRMTACGKEGQIVEIRCGEELLENGRVRHEMRCNCTYQEYWTLSGGRDELEFYDYKAFRYAEVLPEAGASFDASAFAAVVRHYPLDEEACRFDSSDPMLNAIWSICRNGVKYGSQENYVDCPSREKGQYLGDNTIIAHAHAYIAGDLRLYRKALTDFALSAATCPGIMAVAPGHYMQEIADFSLQWPLQLLEYYRQSGDIDFLREMLPTAERMLRHFDRFRREDGLLAHVDDKWNLVDWPEGMRDGYDFPLARPVGEGCHNVVNAFYYGALAAVEEMRSILSVRAEPAGRLDAVRRAFRRVFYSEDAGLFVDAEGSRHASLHANALPLLFGLVEPGERPGVIRFLREKRLSCGVYMSYFLLKALASAGEHALVYELIRSEDLHSWSTMVKEGATTCFEAWSKELKWNTSLCHPWASAPIPLLIEEIIGLKPAEPGWKRVAFHPRIPASLGRLTLSLRVPTGVIRLEYEDGATRLSLPEGVALCE